MRVSRIDKLDKQAQKIEHNVGVLANEEHRVAETLINIDDVVNDLDEEFSRRTGIVNKHDMKFLFFAVMLQSLRWILSPELSVPNMENGDLKHAIEDRLENKEKNHKGGEYEGKSSGKPYEDEKINEYLNKHKEKADESRNEYHGEEGRDTKYRTWIEILLRNVPYDAMNSDGSGEIPNIRGLNSYNPETNTYSNLSPSNHHTATLGHDPVLGWVFGTANIMSSTISYITYQSYEVIQTNPQLNKWRQVINYSRPYSFFEILKYCIGSTTEDSKRLPAAVVRQAWHLASDKYCKIGLPIPLLSSIDPEKMQRMIEKGWNNEEFKALLGKDAINIGANVVICILINLIIKAIYLFCFDAGEPDFDLKSVRIQKILLVSNAIVSASNVIYVAVSKNVGKLDIGGIGVTILELFKTRSFIDKVKTEFITKGIDKAIMGTDNWLDLLIKEE